MEDLSRDFMNEGARNERDRIVSLIDELQRYGSNGLKKICYIDAEELKARIKG